MKHFVGSKGGAGIAQWLITMMPPHDVYVEPFLGRGFIFKTKARARLNIGIEADSAVIDSYWREVNFGTDWTGQAIVHGDALAMLPGLKTDSNWLIYADPPYLMSTRSCQRDYYGREFSTDAEHEKLLSILTGLQAKVMISGYASSLYSMRLKTWRVSSFWTVNRRGQRVQEFCWMNFEPPASLHDPRFVGHNFTDRQRVSRKCDRWRKKFEAMPANERSAILATLMSTGNHSQEHLQDPGCAQVTLDYGIPSESPSPALPLPEVPI